MALMVRRYDLPLARDAASRYLPWIIALMVYLATLALTCAMTVNGLIAEWSQGVAGSLTVQIIPPPEGDDAIAMARKLRTALELLRAEPAIIAAEVLDQAELLALVEPWLGDGLVDNRALPLPRLIDVVVDPRIPLDLRGLQQRLATAVPKAALDDHKMWLGDLIDFARSIQFLSILVVGLVTAACVFVVIFATRAGFAIHSHVVEVLHLIGAQDSYIASQFQSYALSLGIRGGIVGLVLAALTLAGLAFLAQRVDATLLPRLPFHPLLLLVLLVVPAGATMIAMLTARMTVMRGLTRMM